MAHEHIDLWRDAIDDDAERVWGSFREEPAPPLRHSFVTREAARPERWLLAAAIVVVMVTGAWNMSLMRQLEEVRNDYVMAALATDLSATRLASLHRLSGEPLSSAAIEALKDLVRAARDPNIQLAALDLLLDGHALPGDGEIQALLREVRHNGRFIETAVRARTAQT